MIILEEINHHADAQSFCKKLFRNFNHSIDARFKALGVNMSIGISLYPDDSSDPDQLIEMADEALYWVKNHTKGECQFFNLISENESSLLIEARNARP